MRCAIVLAIMTALAAKAQVGGGQGRPPSFPMGTGAGNAVADSGFRPWLAVNGTFRKSLDENRTGGNVTGFNPGVAGGISGWKNWNRKKFEGSYFGSAGNFKDTNSNSGWRQNHAAMLGYSQQVNQKLTFGLTQVAGMTYGGFGYGSAYGVTGVPGLSGSFGPGSAGSSGSNSEFGDLANNGVVSGELLDTKMKFSLSSGSASYMLNQRWMVSGMGGASFVRRSKEQYSQDTIQAGGGVSYLLTQNSQIGGQFTQQNSRYVNLFGGVSSKSAMLTFQTQITQSMAISGGIGAGMITSDYIGSFPIDPALAALLGTGTILQATRTNFITPYYNAGLSKRFERGGFNVGISRGSSSGNGVLLAGVQDSGVASYSRTINSKFGATWFAAYNRLSGRVATLAVSQSIQTGGMLSVHMFRSLSFTAQGGFRYQDISTSPRRRDLFAGFGLAWSPGGNPFVF